MKVYNLIFSLFNKKDRTFFYYLIILCVISSILEIFSILSLVPVADIILNKDKFFNSKIYLFFNFLKNYSNFDIILLFTIVSVLSILIKVFFSLYVFYLKDKFVFSIVLRIASNLYGRFLKSDYKNIVDANYSNNYLAIHHTAYIGSILSSIILIKIESFLIVLTLILLFIYNAKIAFIICILFIPLSILIVFYVKDFAKKYGTSKRVVSSRNLNNIFNSFNLLKEIKILKKEEYFKNFFYLNKKEDMNADIKLNIIQQIPKSILEIFIFLLFLILILYLFFINEVDDNIVRFSIFFVLSSLRVLPGINRILIAIQNIHQHSSYLISVKKDLRLARFEPLKLNLNKNKLDRKINFNKKIYFKNISFSYDADKKSILKNINLEINKNDIVGLIGESGGGKTTLLNILLGFLNPTKGDVLVDNASIFKNIKKWHNIIGYVQQNIFLFNDSIEKNISLSLNSSEVKDQEKILKIIKVCELEELINKKGMIDDYLIGERNSKISGGQAQRIGIARALYNSPQILILDEATSEIDRATENKILDNIIKYFNGNITIIISSHRIETIRNKCNKIYYLKNNALTKVK
jgi:ABC-type bacteriocin/lantibiotic exporter with double-glycine peptidase domain